MLRRCGVHSLLLLSALSINTVSAMDGYSKNLSATDESLSWLDETHGDRVRGWVRDQNENTLTHLQAEARYKSFYATALELRNSESGANWGKQRLLTIHNGWVYDLLKNESHPRGLWRRTLLSTLRKSNREWELVLDVDELAKKEGRAFSFVMARAWNANHCFIVLSNGGGRFTTLREFDVESRTFVAGFVIPDSTSPSVAWAGPDTLYVAADFGPESLSQYAMPLVIKRLRRGEPLSAATDVFRGDLANDSIVQLATCFVADNAPSLLVAIATTLDRQARTFWKLQEGLTPQRLTLPPKVAFSDSRLYRGQFLFSIPVDWSLNGQVWKGGSILSIPVEDLTRESPKVHLALPPPGSGAVTGEWEVLPAGVLVFSADTARGRLWRLTFDGSSWSQTAVSMPSYGTLARYGIAVTGNIALVTYQSFLQPPTLYQVDAATGLATEVDSMKSEFDQARYVVEQLFATSEDGTRIPYFLVRTKDLKNDGQSPTLLNGYGAFGSPMYPTYGGVMGRLWLDQGGVYVLANIRGGGELGTTWHVTGVARRYTYDDFVAVAHDLFRRKITSPQRLGIMGHSAGGLLVGVMITQHPELFGAAILEAPYLDQLRPDQTAPRNFDYEFGSLQEGPTREFLVQTSPYQNLHRRDDSLCPLIVTSTTDDQVRPGQARRFAAKMKTLNLPFLYYEFPDGGHGLAATTGDQAFLEALEYTYLARELIDKPERQSLRASREKE